MNVSILDRFLWKPNFELRWIATHPTQSVQSFPVGDIIDGSWVLSHHQNETPPMMISPKDIQRIIHFPGSMPTVLVLELYVHGREVCVRFEGSMGAKNVSSFLSYFLHAGDHRTSSLTTCEVVQKKSYVKWWASWAFRRKKANVDKTCLLPMVLHVAEMPGPQLEVTPTQQPAVDDTGASTSSSSDTTDHQDDHSDHSDSEGQHSPLFRE
eukprot:PhF_6_TR6787/c0_g1_i3/m.9770